MTAASSETKGTVFLTSRDFLWSLLCVQCFISTLIEPIYISSPYPAAQVTWIRTWALNLIISLPWSPISLQTLWLNFPAHHESNQNTGKTLWMKDYQCLIFFPVKVRIKLLFQSIKLKTGWGKKWDHWFNDQFKKTDTECFYFTEAPPETTFEDVFLTLKVSFTQKGFFSSNQLSSISSDLNYIKLLHQITVIQQQYLDIG